MNVPGGFDPPPYPYDRLDELKAVAADHEGGIVDLSIGTPYDPPAAAVVEALASSGAERGYPPSIGSRRLREAATGWMRRRLGVDVAVDHVAACVGTKELVTSHGSLAAPAASRVATPCSSRRSRTRPTP